ncbi:tumor necrosis factor ligand superfamily member 8-like [Vombatus ursinus]|uniref:Tumor necrosis factor ligand superfamily member 8 n=1 Tax=Vombatus ursinus TaxID=29139 RepID=A0A4X2JX37_VOMUR|nr:tumor necrosis factor ligand superfamily member 8-like [Vombatus ursinus]XP_027723676.1 tumor necrosis factor ligand superfamily member 8-like [Vombatus ursinus]
MSSVPQQTSLHQLNASLGAAMNVSEGTVTSHLRATSRTYFYFTTATLVLCLIFTLATIMVLVVQKKEPIPQPPEKFPLIGGNCSLDILSILKKPLGTESSAYLQVSKPIRNSKLTWNKDGILNGIGYHNGNLIIQSPGWYIIYCQLQFVVPNCPDNPIDLKLELLINNKTKKQTLVTVCESKTGTKNIYRNLSQFFLENLNVNNTVSIKVKEFQYVDTNTFPLESVLAAFKYSNSN